MKTVQLKNDTWTDEAGTQVPANRITKSEKLREKKADKLATDAQKLNGQLKAFKEFIKNTCDEVTAAIRLEAEMKPEKESKGNFTWYNFDRSVKVECSINERIDFDDTQIAMCKELLDQFINTALSGSENAEMIRDLVRDAFENSKGRLDAKKVMSLLKHRSKIKSALYQKAMVHLEDSIRRPDSRTYYRVWIKNGEGAYEVVDLNFSSI